MTMADTEPARVSVRLTTEEAWVLLRDAHTGIFTTLRRDGVPISLPVWFAVVDHDIFVRTPSRSKKVARVQHDARASFLVEAGERWADLRAVHLTGRAEIVETGDQRDRAGEELQRKYATFRTSRAHMPERTAAHYATSEALIRFRPDERTVSWDNRRLGLA
jgi:PPOX class probable F420-dependent enzyme